MDNQHRKISGYRELTQGDIDLINEIKAHEKATLALHARVMETERVTSANAAGNLEPVRWAGIAKDNLQIGHMALIRAIAQPA